MTGGYHDSSSGYVTMEVLKKNPKQPDSARHPIVKKNIYEAFLIRGNRIRNGIVKLILR
jgi:hypothetical protein